MSDGRPIPIDRIYIPHAIAYVNAWQVSSQRKPGFIPDSSPNGTPIDFFVSEALKRYRILSQFPNEREVNLFGDGSWLPKQDILSSAINMALISPVSDPPKQGYSILVGPTVFERAFSRHCSAEFLRQPYIDLVEDVVREIGLEKEALCAA